MTEWIAKTIKFQYLPEECKECRRDKPCARPEEFEKVITSEIPIGYYIPSEIGICEVLLSMIQRGYKHHVKE